MLHGPPGCGKTLAARSVAAEFNAEVHEISAASVFGAYTGRQKIATSLIPYKQWVLFVARVWDSLSQSERDCCKFTAVTRTDGAHCEANLHQHAAI